MNKTAVENLIKELVERMTISVSEISLDDEERTVSSRDGMNSAFWFKVQVSDPHSLWDNNGEGLSALNHILRKMADKIFLSSKKSDTGEKLQDNFEIMVDINGFQKKKIENVRSLAHMMAERARYFKSSIEIDPMPAFERRIVHEFLSDATDLKTESQGEGKSRRVVIKYIGAI